jgi:hypothetical protein
MVKNKEFEYYTVVETKMSGVEIFKIFESDLSDMHFLRHLESYYCILRWKNLIRGSFYKKTTKKHFF